MKRMKDGKKKKNVNEESKKKRGGKEFCFKRDAWKKQSRKKGRTGVSYLLVKNIIQSHNSWSRKALIVIFS